MSYIIDWNLVFMLIHYAMLWASTLKPIIIINCFFGNQLKYKRCIKVLTLLINLFIRWK